MDKLVKKLSDVKDFTVPWTPDVVYAVYRNDTLEELPIGILEEMKLHIENVIKSKQN